MNKTLINKRFLECVEYLISETKTENKGSIAQKMSIKPSKFSEILNNRMSIGLEDLAVFSNVFNFDCNYLLLGKGEMLEKINRTQSNQQSVEVVQHTVEESTEDYKTDLIESLKEQVADLRKDKEMLYALLDRKMGNAKTG